MTTISNAALHHALLRHVVDHARGPGRDELAAMLAAEPADVDEALRRLHDDHGVVLHPHTPDVWVIHPFSLAPTAFTLRSGGRVWWSNCAWCSLGAAALLDRDVSIVTTVGGEGRQVELTVRNGELEPSSGCVHFPVPMRQAWDNVIYTCSVMLLFESEPQVDDWCRRHAIAKGDVQPLSRVWAFAKVWYGRHLSPTWRKWSIDEARAIFERFGFTHDVWRLPPAEGRFLDRG